VAGVDAIGEALILLARGALSACDFGHCIRSISIRKAWWRCGVRLSWLERFFVARPGATGIIRNSSASRLTSRRAWQSTPISLRYMQKQRPGATTLTAKRLGRFVRCHAYHWLAGSSATNGGTSSESWPRATLRCIQDGVALRTRRITRCFAYGQVPRRRGSEGWCERNYKIAERTSATVSLVATRPRCFTMSSAAMRYASAMVGKLKTLST